MKRKMRNILTLIWFVLVLFAFLSPGQPVHALDSGEPVALVLNARGPLTPAMVEYISRGLRQAEDRGAEVLILQLNTPGGSIELMNRIVEVMRNSSVPVVVYVSPPGAMAGSAGTIITLAGHVAAMAPDTTIGAASPVGSEGQDIGEAMESKAKEILKATARNLAKDRPLPAIELAEATIETAKAATVDEALQVGMVDIKADNLADLLEQLDKRQVHVGGEVVTLRTRGALLIPLPLNFIEDILQMLTNPNIVFLLLSIGVQAILIELSSPGGWVAGFIGVVCLLLAVYGLGVLPVNWFGILFLVMSFVLFILDIKAPTHGGLTVAGVASFIVGALVLFNSVRVPGFPPVSVPLVVATGVAIGLVFLGMLTFALRAMKAPIQTGRESLIGKTGFARSLVEYEGQVQVGGEMWSATLADEDSEPIQPGTRIVVVAVDGLRVKVRRI